MDLIAVLVGMSLWLVGGLFCLKIVWNLGVPYELARRRLQPRSRAKEGISLSAGIEVLLLALAVFLSSVSEGEGWLDHPANVFWWGFAAIVISYVHMVIAAILAGYVVSKFCKPTEDERESR